MRRARRRRRWFRRSSWTNPSDGRVLRRCGDSRRGSRGQGVVPRCLPEKYLALDGIDRDLAHRSMRYDPRRGGHAPGHLRDAFCDWVEAGMRDDEVGAGVLYEGPRPLRWLLGQLHNCSDILPTWVADEL